MANTPLTKGQKKALARVQKRLTASFARSLKRISKAGNARTWMMPYLKKMLAEYRRARPENNRWCFIDLRPRSSPP